MVYSSGQYCECRAIIKLDVFSGVWAALTVAVDWSIQSVTVMSSKATVTRRNGPFKSLNDSSDRNNGSPLDNNWLRPLSINGSLGSRHAHHRIAYPQLNCAFRQGTSSRKNAKRDQQKGDH